MGAPVTSAVSMLLVPLVAAAACGGSSGRTSAPTAADNANEGSGQKTEETASICRAQLTADLVATLEAGVRDGRETCTDRARLSAHYFDLQLEIHDRWQPQIDEHLVWLAERCPGSDQTCLLTFMHPSVALVRAWDLQATVQPRNSVVFANADVVRRQAQRAVALRDEPHRFDALGALAEKALTDGDTQLASAYAMQALLHLPVAPKSWNTGNLIYDAHTVLGHIALRAGDVAAAKRHLLAAARTPGSPQLNTFGPDMELAIDLLAAGERDAVIEYLELCKRFWQQAGSSLDEWQREIRDGEPTTMPRRRR